MSNNARFNLLDPRGVQTTTSPSRHWRGFKLLLPAALTVGFTLLPALATGLQALPIPYSASISDWPKGKTGSVTLEGDLATGTVDALGRFTIVLPTLEQSKHLRSTLAPLSGLFTDDPNLNLPADRQCKGKGKITPDTALGNEFYLFASVDGGEPVRLNLYSDASDTPGKTYGSLQFYDTSITFDGVVTCTNYALTYKGTFPEGWSLNSHALSEFDAKTGFETQSITDLLPTAVSWHLYSAVGRIGLQFAPATSGSAGLNVIDVTSGGAAEKAGVRLNDLLVEVDGKSVLGLEVNQVTALITGRPGTTVTLGVRRGTETTVRSFPVTRARIQLH